MESNWRRSLVNLHQTPEERKSKYKLSRALGGSCYQADRMRDWRWNKIARWAGYYDYMGLQNSLNKLLNEEDERE